ncbi:NUDIX hydrolase [Alkalibacterium iburiense]|uniref:NUDIX hydrolase n=1 Tax=Alkalibacterium iburiense TaxID=290589 RepID=A0ABP3H8G4_9LACT
MNIFTRVIVKDEAGAVLVIQDREKSWNFPGGKLEEGETPEACAKRETMEEIGLKIENLSGIYQGHFIFNSIEWKGYFYFAESVSGKAFINEPDKIKGLKYIQNSEEVNFPAELSTCIRGVFTHQSIIQKKIK